MTIASDLRQEIRLLFQRLVQPSGTPLTNAQVIPEQDGGPRPPLPYLTVRVNDAGTQIGEADLVSDTDGSGNARTRARTWHRALCSVNGYGDEAGDWIRELVIKLQMPNTVAYTQGRNLTVRPVGPPRNLGAMIDTGFEPRWQQDLELDFGLLVSTADADTAPALEVVVLDDLEGDPGAYQQEVTITLP